MQKIKFILLLPICFNDGRKIPKKELNAILNQLYELGGGCSLADEVKGAYRMKDGTKQVDRLYSVWICIHESEEGALRKLVADIGAQLGQETMYLERTAGTVEFIPASQPEEGSDESEIN